MTDQDQGHELDPKLESIREEILQKALQADDPEAKAEQMLTEAGVDADGVKELDTGSLPTSLSFLLGHQHAAKPEVSLKDLEAAVKREASEGKSPSDILSAAGLDPQFKDEIDGAIENPMVAFLVGYRFNQEKVPA